MPYYFISDKALFFHVVEDFCGVVVVLVVVVAFACPGAVLVSAYHRLVNIWSMAQTCALLLYLAIPPAPSNQSINFCTQLSNVPNLLACL